MELIAFESGGSVQEGDLLVQLDTRQEQAQLAAAEAERDLAHLNFVRTQGLVNEGAISRAEYDRAAAEQKRTEARVGEIRATIDRKTIRAPFSGVLGIRQVNLGQCLSGGDPVVPLQSLDPIHVNFGVPQQEAGQVRNRKTRGRLRRRAHNPLASRSVPLTSRGRESTGYWGLEQQFHDAVSESARRPRDQQRASRIILHECFLLSTLLLRLMT